MDCVNCKQIIPAKCVRTEEDNLEELLIKITKDFSDINDLLNKQIDKKWIKTSHSVILDYIQELVNEVGILREKITPEEQKFQINSGIVVGEKSALQLFNILFKEVEAIKKNLNSDTSSMYLI